VIDALKAKHPHLNFEIVQIRTRGDKDQTSSLSKIGGKGVFVKAIEEALLNGEIDMAVHSMKDLPTRIAGGTVLAAVPKRKSPYDIVVFRQAENLDQVPAGGRIGTSSQRRKVQLQALRPDLEIVDIRGNIETRLKKMASEGLDGVMLAEAGLSRLGFLGQACFPSYQVLDEEACVPAAGQGALAVQCREEDHDLRHLLGEINHDKSSKCVKLERAFLRELGADCTYPVGAYARMTLDGDISLTGMLGA